MSVRYRPPLAVLGLACALAAGCCSPCRFEEDPCCSGSSIAGDEPTSAAGCCKRCSGGCPAPQIADPPPDPITDVPASAADGQASCPPQVVCPPVVEKRKHKHVARRVRHRPEPPVENVVVVGPESQFVPVPTRPVFGPRVDARSIDEQPPDLLPPDVQPQVMPAPQILPSPSPGDSPPKPASASSAGKKQAAKSSDLTSSLQILK
jgi:hypothetical protein